MLFKSTRLSSSLACIMLHQVWKASGQLTAAAASDPLLALPAKVPMPSALPAGTPSKVTGAPPLPAVKINPSDYPPLDKVPPTDTDLVRKWVAKIDLSKAPAVKPTGKDGCSNSTFNPDQITKAGADGNCWWTCGGCTRDTDVTFCPNKGTWGASFDDGPSEYTPTLLKYLDDQSLKATFFVVGSRVISHPAVLQASYMASHHQCIHTWSHNSLTTLTNEQVVAEIAWTMKAFQDVLGVTPNCVRPPYGDLDDRVRYILKAMGLTIYIWTSAGSGNFDTDDWKVVSGSTTPAESSKNFQKILSTQATLSTGFIVLAHDLYPEAVALSMNSFLPMAKETKVKIQSISTCMGLDLAQTYFETATGTSASKSILPTNVTGDTTQKAGSPTVPQNKTSIAAVAVKNSTSPSPSKPGDSAPKLDTVAPPASTPSNTTKSAQPNNATSTKTAPAQNRTTDSKKSSTKPASTSSASLTTHGNLCLYSLLVGIQILTWNLILS